MVGFSTLRAIFVWAVVYPFASPVSGQESTWCRHPIDVFIQSGHVESRFAPTESATRQTLIRRLSLDLLGIPPTPKAVDAFVADMSPDAYEKLVDRLLASPTFGERMAQFWLDLARYADSDGYHDDADRSMWQYRDWVIDSFNINKPFDQFTIEQLAGDLLPNATLDQHVATAFLRNGPTSTEDGANPEEYRARYAVDRVNSMATIWLGLTMACAECHDHKYDPITTREYYQLIAFFNQVDERPLFRGLHAPPSIAVPSPKDIDAIDDLEKRINAGQQNLESKDLRILSQKWKAGLLVRELPTRPRDALACEFLFQGNGTELTNSGSRGRVASMRPSSTGRIPASTKGIVDKAIEFSGFGDAIDLGQLFEFRRFVPFTLEVWLQFTKLGGPLISKMGNIDGRGFDVRVVEGRITIRMIDDWPDAAIAVSTVAKYPANRWLHLSVTYDGSATAEGIHVYFNGEPQDLNVDVRSDVLKTIQNRAPLTIGGNSDTDNSFAGIIDELRFYKWPLSTRELVNAPEWKLQDAVRQQLVAAEQTQLLDEFFRDYVNPETTAMRREIGALQQNKEQFAIPRLRIMRDTTVRRPTHVLVRGDFRSPGEQVRPKTPSMLPPLPPTQAQELSRLDLARWIVSPDNTLTAKVTANRLWALLLGRGIVETLDDFGAQGTAATHPELLDYLARELRRTDWDTKSLIRQIVTSAAYRQSSSVSKEVWERDPYNRLVARGPRKRLTAEAIRDNALHISGLLVDRVGGPSVRPYQPSGLWRDMSKGNEEAKAYQQSNGEDLYRRGIYTFWKRSIHYPAFAIFDAPNREICTSSRPTTNTPSQSLVLLNDPTFVEAARVFASTIMRNATEFETRIQFAYRRGLGRHATRHEIDVLRVAYRDLEIHYIQDLESAQKLLAVGHSNVDMSLDAVKLATWTSIAQIILTLDEMITQE